jgi:hypothetical protein
MDLDEFKKYFEKDSLIIKNIRQEVIDNSLKICENIKEFIYFVTYLHGTGHGTIAIDFSLDEFETSFLSLEIGSKSIGFFGEIAFDSSNILVDNISIINEEDFEESMQILKTSLFKVLNKRYLLTEKNIF